MEEYENQVAKYLRKVGNYARYCVTHDFLGNELIPRRIQMRLVLTMIFYCHYAFKTTVYDIISQVHNPV